MKKIRTFLQLQQQKQKKSPRLLIAYIHHPHDCYLNQGRVGFKMDAIILFYRSIIIQLFLAHF